MFLVRTETDTWEGWKLVTTAAFFHLLFLAWPKLAWIAAYKVNICNETTFTYVYVRCLRFSLCLISLQCT